MLAPTFTLKIYLYSGSDNQLNFPCFEVSYNLRHVERGCNLEDSI